MSTSEITQDKRAEPRHRTLFAGEIIFHNGNSTFDCKVRDVSKHGAHLVMPDTRDVPEEFDLFLPHDGTRRRARLVWRHAQDIGLVFTDDPPGTAPAG